MVDRETQEDDAQATYEIGLLGSVPDSLRRRHPPMNLCARPEQTLLFRRGGGPGELDVLLEQLSSLGVVLTEIHARACPVDADAAQGPALGADCGSAVREYEVSVLGRLGEKLLRHLGWSHCSRAEQQVAWGDATACELNDFLSECSRLGLVIERVHKVARLTDPRSRAGDAG